VVLKANLRSMHHGGGERSMRRCTMIYLYGTTNSPDEIVPLSPLINSGIQLLVQPELEDMLQ
jgi:hypothetical protein